MPKENKGIFKRIRRIVAKTPNGKVLTYGDVAQIVGIKDARKVGWALHGNQDPKIPCQRVVKAGGFLADNYSLGGSNGQRKLLLADGVKFIKTGQVDMGKHHWDNARTF